MANMQKFMQFLIPYLSSLAQIQKQKGYIDYQTRAYYENFLKQLEARQGAESQGREEQLRKDALLAYYKLLFGGAETAYRPEAEAIKRAREIGLNIPGLEGVTIPENYNQPYEQAMGVAGSALDTGKMPSENELLAVANALGPKASLELFGNVGTEKRSVRSEKLERDKLAEREARRKFEEGRGGKGGKSNLTELGKFLTGYNKQITDLEKKKNAAEFGEDTSAVDAEIAKVAAKRNLTMSKMEKSFPGMDKLNAIISKLKERGSDAIGLEKHKQDFMKAESLSEEEYQYIKASL
jgi:hypothetical protein